MHNSVIVTGKKKSRDLMTLAQTATFAKATAPEPILPSTSINYETNDDVRKMMVYIQHDICVRQS